MMRVSSVGLFAIACLTLACSENDPPTGPTTGSIDVAVTTTGENLPTGYTVALDGSTTRTVNANGSVSFTSVATGSHEVGLTDVPANCSVVSANPATLTVSAGVATPVAMSVACNELVGSIEVSVASVGEDIPASYVVVIDKGIESQPVNANGSVTFTGLAVGTHEVDLTEIPLNCSVTGEDPVSAIVEAGAVASVAMAVECNTRNGSIEVTATTTGELLDEDGYLVSLEGVGSGTLLITDGAITFSDVPPGPQLLTISDIADSCELLGDADRIVEVQPGSSIVEVFEVACDWRSVISFNSVRDGNLEIYSMQPDGRKVRNLSNHPISDTEESWSPDGTRIAFWSYRDSGPDIWVMDADGSNQTRLTTAPGNDVVPVWSPDGSRIAFQSDRDLNRQIYVMDADGSNQTRLTQDGFENIRPVWSADGTLIAYYSQGEIFTVSADGTTVRQLTDQGGAYPIWSPVEPVIAFGSSRSGSMDIYVMNSDGSGQVNITNAPGSENFPSWSPDGTRIVYVTDRDGNPEIYVMNADGSGQVRLTNDPGEDGDPTWSPDGEYIAFWSNRTGDDEIFVVRVDGTGLKNISNAPGHDVRPHWSPILP